MRLRLLSVTKTAVIQIYNFTILRRHRGAGKTKLLPLSLKHFFSNKFNYIKLSHHSIKICNHLTGYIQLTKAHQTINKLIIHNVFKNCNYINLINMPNQIQN